MFKKYEEWINCNFGTSFSVEVDTNTKPVSNLILLFSVILLFGTFLVGIAQSLSEHQVVIDGAKIISYRAGYLSTLTTSGSSIIAGCIVGLLGSFIHILLFNKYSYINYITNAFLINAFGSILYGILSFINYMVSGQKWLIDVILLTITISVFLGISYLVISRIVMRRHYS